VIRIEMKIHLDLTKEQFTLVTKALVSKLSEDDVGPARELCRQLFGDAISDSGVKHHALVHARTKAEV